MQRINDVTWAAEFDQKLSPGLYFPTRMTVVDAGDGELLLYSPIPIDSELERDIRSLGDVRWIIAPNDFHHLHVENAAKVFPGAAVFGAPGAVKKQNRVDFSGVLTDGGPKDLPESVVTLNIEGIPVLEETVLWLPDASTLVCSDLVFNMHDPKTWLTGLVLKMVTGRGDEPVQSRSFKWFFVKDKGAYSESIRDLITRPFDTLVMAHGEVVEEGGSAALRNAVDWAIQDELARIAA